jgi:SAM-dependent methyltransferase
VGIDRFSDSVGCSGVLDSLHLRPRGKPLAGLLSQLTRGRVPAPRTDRLRRERTLDTLRAYVTREYEDSSPVTEELLRRLDDADVASVMAHLDHETQRVWDKAPSEEHGRLTLILGVCHHVPAVLERTGLRIEMPPDDVHAMARGPLAAGGDFWTADLIAAAARRHGFAFGDAARVLDFGCSSARHLRVLQAWRPDVAWMGCDPNERAIDWASGALPGIEFFVSPQEPPLDLEAGSLDAVFAISVWSHFAHGAAIRWLDEMQRLVRPGGLLIFTTQGTASLAHYLRHDEIDDEYAVSAAEALLVTGHGFLPAFGPDGDFGVESPEWGMAYLSLEWLAQHTLPHWTLESYEPARIESNQDLIVLRRSQN